MNTERNPDDFLQYMDLVRGYNYPKSKSQVDRDVKAGRFPRPLKLGHRTVGWKRRDFESYLASLQAE